MKKSIWLLILSGLLGAALAGAPPTITLLSPQNGATWRIGNSYPIAWSTVNGVTGRVFILLFKYNAANQLEFLGRIADVNYKRGSYLWKAGEHTGKMAGDDAMRMAGYGRYHIVVRLLCSQYVENQDNNYFRLTPIFEPRL
jgi:hypothetical protein